MRIALAQINTTVGDIAGNCRKIVEQARRARERGAALVLFPEMAVTGYPPEDLLLRPSFLEENLAGGVRAETTIDNPGGVREPDRTMSASSTAYGNVIGASACSECRQDINATGSQINGANVSARTRIATGSAGSVGASATAVGNAATYQTVNPHR